MRFAELVGWTPVAVNFGRALPSIDWGDLRGRRFSEPFFDQTVERWAGANPKPLKRTNFDALLALDQEPSLEPSALIFHLSRCGSTLISRLLGTLTGALVLSEPAAINSLLMRDPVDIDRSAQVELLRLLVRALGRRRFGDERHYVLKLSSWNVSRLALYRRAFPHVPVIWVQRNPVEVMASLLARAPGWLGEDRFPLQARSIFGIDPEETAALGPEAFCARVLNQLLAAAIRHTDPESTLYVDYTELPDAIWTRVAPFAGMPAEATDIARMREAAQFYAKDPVPRPFAAGSESQAAISDRLRLLAAELVDPLYNELDRRRRAQLGSAD